MTRFNLLNILLICFLSGYFLSCNNDTQMDSADLIITGGIVSTMDPDLPECGAIAVKDGKIFKTGTIDEISALKGENTQEIQLNGERVIPGLIDGHGHYLGMGDFFLNLNLLDSKSFAEILDSVKLWVDKTPGGQWVEGRGWHQDKWDIQPEDAVDFLPVHEKLTAISPNHPVILKHASGHILLANQYAMDLMGITGDSINPDGGEISRDELGNLTGIFKEKAYNNVTAFKALDQQPTDRKGRMEHFIKRVRLAEQNCLKHGITSFHDAGSTFDETEMFEELALNNELNVRLYIMVLEPIDTILKKAKDHQIKGLNGFLTVNAFKQYYDGAMGSKSAYLHKEYTDDPDNNGIRTVDPVEYTKLCKFALENGFQVCTHAIGDQANHEVLNVYEQLLGDQAGKRWRIEHAQHLLQEDIGRFAEMGVLAAMQSIHCVSDASWIEDRLGPERTLTGAYVWRKLIDSGAMVLEGTDVPVESINPFENIYAAVSRQYGDGNIFYADQVKTLQEAVESYTINNAYGAFEEKLKGSITPGKMADITILNRDIFTVSKDEIPETEVLYTLVGGEIKYIHPSLNP